MGIGNFLTENPALHSFSLPLCQIDKENPRSPEMDSGPAGKFHSNESEYQANSGLQASASLSFWAWASARSLPFVVK